MDSSRTRFLLRAMRPNGADHDDPTFSAALEQTHADPGLRAWFEREQAVDRALVSKLREVRAPAELRAHILEGLAISFTSGEARRSSRPAVALVAAALAAAASIALLIYTLLPAARGPRLSLDLVVAAAVRETAEPPALALRTDSRAEIVAWLQEAAVPVPDALPGQLAAQDVVGCNITEWQGVRCSLITMRAPGLADPGANADAAAPPAASREPTLIHLYLVPRRSCSSQGIGLTPRVARHDAATVATWRDAETNYVLVARAPPGSVQRLLGPEATLAWAGGAWGSAEAL